MSGLSRLLRTAAELHGTLEDQLAPGAGRGGGEKVSGGTSGSAPPARLDVIAHRDRLRRRLAWWVDAVADRDERLPRPTVRSMAAWLTLQLPVMADEDHRLLGTQLEGWLRVSYRILGDRDALEDRALPPDAWDRQVPVHEAARILGVTARTVQRRAARRDGLVRLGDAHRPPVPRCPHTDLEQQACDHCLRARVAP